MRIGIDLGGTKIEGIAIDENGVECERLRVPTPKGDYGAVVNAVAKLVLDIERDRGQKGTVGVGIAPAPCHPMLFALACTDEKLTLDRPRITLTRGTSVVVLARVVHSASYR